jgi:N-acetylneuraminic acid mutarotase
MKRTLLAALAAALFSCVAPGGSVHYLKDSSGNRYDLPAQLSPSRKRAERPLNIVRGDGQTGQFALADGGPEPGLYELAGEVKRADATAIKALLDEISAKIATATVLGFEEGTYSWEKPLDTLASARGAVNARPSGGFTNAVVLSVKLAVGGGGNLATGLTSPASTITLPDGSTPTGGTGSVAPRTPWLQMGDSPSPGSWAVKASMPHGRWQHAGAALGGLFYVIGGMNTDLGAYDATVVAYDPSTNTWASKASLPVARSHLAAAALDGYLYAVGGRVDSFNLTNALTRYDPVGDTWATLAPMPTARRNLALVPLGGKLYAVGGNAWAGDGGWSLSAKVEEYDPATNTWAARRDLPVARASLFGFATSDRVVVVGGVLVISSQDQATDLAHEYDPLNNQWANAPRPSVKTAEGAAVSLSGYGYLVGGEDHPYSGNPRAMRYDPSNGNWHTLAALPIWRVWTAAGVVGGKVYVAGGDAGDDDTAACLEFTP